MVYLITACGLLLLAPLYSEIFNKNKYIKSIVELSIMSYLLYAIFFHILPESWATLQYNSIILATVAFLSFYAVELKQLKYQKTLKSFNSIILIGVFLHMLVDGAALGGYQFGLNLHSSKPHLTISKHLGLSILVHRVPMGIIIWKMLVNQMNKNKALIIMGLFSIANIVGFYFISATTRFIDGSILIAITQSLVVGGLLHYFADKIIKESKHYLIKK